MRGLNALLLESVLWAGWTHAEDPEKGQTPVRALDFPDLADTDPAPLAVGSLHFYPIERSGRSTRPVPCSRSKTASPSASKPVSSIAETTKSAS